MREIERVNGLTTNGMDEHDHIIENKRDLKHTCMDEQIGSSTYWNHKFIISYQLKSIKSYFAQEHCM